MSWIKLFSRNVKFVATALCVTNWKHTALWAALLPACMLLFGAAGTHKRPAISDVLLDAGMFVGLIAFTILCGALLRMMHPKKS